MSPTQQNIISFIIILAVVAFIAWLGQKPALTPAGLVSVNPDIQIDQRYTAQEVNLYQFAPKGAQVLGAVTAELAVNKEEKQQKQIEQVVQYVRGLAANAGANGIMVEIFAPRGQVLYFTGRLLKV